MDHTVQPKEPTHGNGPASQMEAARITTKQLNQEATDGTGKHKKHKHHYRCSYV